MDLTIESLQAVALKEYGILFRIKTEDGIRDMMSYPEKGKSIWVSEPNHSLCSAYYYASDSENYGLTIKSVDEFRRYLDKVTSVYLKNQKCCQQSLF